MNAITTRIPLVTCAGAVLLAIPATALAQFPENLNVSDFDGVQGFTVVGHMTREFGFSVAGIGDVNADGIDDFASGGPGVFPEPNCGWPETCPDCEPTPGAVYVIFGREDIAGGGSWTTAEIDGTKGFRIEGLVANGETGAVAPAGDFNNDGIEDFLVGADSAGPFGVFRAGEVYLIYGQPGLGNGGDFDLASLDGANGFTIHGTFSLGAFGRSRAMARIGDFDGDGWQDLALGAAGADPGGLGGAGQVYLIYGGRGVGDSGSFVVPNDINAKTGIVFEGIAAGDLAGHAVSSPGDFNGDGLDDLLISALGADPQPLATGQVYLIYGGLTPDTSGVFELSDLTAEQGFVINGPASPQSQSDTRTGESVAGVGDINDDGFDDIAIAVDTGDDYVAVIFGGPNVAPDGLFCLDELNGANGFKLIRDVGVAATVRVGGSPGDLNSDGIDDLFVYLHGGQVIFGAPTLGASGTVAIDTLDGRYGFRPPAGGTDRSFAGDVNNDGIDDIIAGLSYQNDESEDVGRVFVVFGRRMGDGDVDADVDFADFGAFQACFASELGNTDPDADPDVPDECHPFDFDLDNDVDLTDYSAFQNVFGTSP